MFQRRLNHKICLVTKVKTNLGKNTKMYKCQACGYVYDPGEGDSLGGIEAGTEFENLPDTWKCPICEVGKEEFAALD